MRGCSFVRPLSGVLPVLSLLMLFAFAAPGAALAQSDSEVAAARALFEEGVGAAATSRWADALSAFERSYAIAPRSTTLLNLAGAQVQLGRLVAAAESYRRLIRDAGSDARERRLRNQAREALEALEPRLGHLTLRIDDVAPSDRITLDDSEVAHAILGVATPVDPGAHTVSVRDGSTEIGRASVTVGEGAREELSVRLRRRASGTVASSEAPPTDNSVPDAALSTEASTSSGGEDIAASPVLWTVIGVVVVGGVVAAVVATQVSTGPGPYMGNVGDGVIRF